MNAPHVTEKPNALPAVACSDLLGGWEKAEIKFGMAKAALKLAKRTPEGAKLAAEFLEEAAAILRKTIIAPVKKFPRVICPTCGKLKPVAKSGWIRSHQGGPNTDKNGWCKANHENFMPNPPNAPHEPRGANDPKP